MTVFEVASVGLALLEEASTPVGIGVTRGEIVDRLYESSTADSDRSDKVAFVVAAGGEL